MASSASKKIDVDELKHRLADSLRNPRNKENSYSMMNTAPGTSALSQSKKASRGRSKSPGHSFGEGDMVPERGSAVKESGQEPAWYKALKRSTGK